MKLFHGSCHLFKKFALTGAGDGSGIKFGHGVYLTEAEATAVHYSNPRPLGETAAPAHYLYTVEIDDLTPENHFRSHPAVPAAVRDRVEKALGVRAPDDVAAQGKEFRKWVGQQLRGGGKPRTPGEKAAAEKAAAVFLDGLGVHYFVWPQSQANPDGLRNVCVFNPDNVRILEATPIQVERKNGKWVRVF